MSEISVIDTKHESELAGGEAKNADPFGKFANKSFYRAAKMRKNKGYSDGYAKDLAKLIYRDLNNNTSSPSFTLYSKDEIATFLANPYRNQKQLRDASIYIYNASSHYRRLIQYFVGLSDFSYVVSPFNIDPQTADPKKVHKNYRKVLKTITSFNVAAQLPKILTVCFREDVFYGTLWEGSDSIIIQQLPSDFCDISTIEGNVCNVSFDFSYFDSRRTLLPYFPPEFTEKYNFYQNNRTNKWIELNCPTSFAIKYNNDILEYALPPFAGILREVYDIEDYKQLKLSRTALENYAMVWMKIPMNQEGEVKMSEPQAREFFDNLDEVLPEEVGAVLTPMEMGKINFEKSNLGNTDTISEAEQAMYSAAGVSSLLFANTKASSNALLLSTKVDQAMTFGIIKSIECAINRYIQWQSYGKNFKVTFLDTSSFNRKEVGDQYLKAAQYGLPTVILYAASQGLGQAEFESMNFLENDVLGLKDLLMPLKSSATMSSSSTESEGATDEGGAPPKDIGEISDSRESNSERE